MQNLGGRQSVLWGIGKWTMEVNNWSMEYRELLTYIDMSQNWVLCTAAINCSVGMFPASAIYTAQPQRGRSVWQFKNCWIVTARSRSLTESLKIPLVRQNWGRQYTACKEYYNVYVAWIHVHIKSQISISNLYFNTVKIHQVFCYI